ncbi:hypothetical protein [Chitinophaga sancti]|uniref:hypothetical protein n=1 Tax=Chitinophaga sancti TaxID=1004 RepID=UPI003F7A06CF
MSQYTSKTGKPDSTRKSATDTTEPPAFFSNTQETNTFFTPLVQAKSLNSDTGDPDESIRPKNLIQGSSIVQRQKDGEGETIPFEIKIPKGTLSQQEFRRYAELKIFNRIVNFEWAANAGAAEIYQDISKHIGETVTFKVSRSSLAKYKTSNGEAGKGDETVSDDTGAEIDKRFYESTGIAPGTKINKGEQGRIDIWNDFKKQVLSQKRKLDNLPPAIKEFLRADQTFTPENYAKLNDIASLLDQFDVADFLDYKSKISIETTDLEELKRSIAAYLEEKKKREQAQAEKGKIEDKIDGLETLYKRYKEFKKGEGSYKAIPGSDEFGVHDNNREYLRKAEDAERIALTTAMQAHGFKSIDDFELYVNNYEAAFRKETIAIASDHLQRYRHVLFEAEKKLNDDNYVTRLFNEISKSGAKEHYDKASEKMSEAIMAGGYSENITEYQIQRQLELSGESEAEKSAGDKLITGLPSASPIMQEEGFNKEKLSRIKSKQELKSFLQAYIDEKKESIKNTWIDITTHDDRIYELGNLINVSKQMQGVTDDSIFELIIKDKVKDLGTVKILKAVCFVVIGIALTIASFGTGLPAILAAGASLGLSVYAVHEEIEKYKTDSDAHDVGLLSDGPNLVWVVLAIIGAGMDAAAVGAAFKAAKPLSEAAKAFNKTHDVVELQKSLAKLSTIDAKIQQNIVSAAKARAGLQKSLEALKASMSGRMFSMIAPGSEQMLRLLIVGYDVVKKTAVRFKGFLLQLQKQKIIAEVLSEAERSFYLGVYNDIKKLTDADIVKIEKDLQKIVDRTALTERNRTIAQKITEDLKVKGSYRKAPNYHADTSHGVTEDQVKSIISAPEAVFESGNGQRLYYLKDGTIVVVEGGKSSAGNVITAYGKLGKKGESGAKALGGLASDPGEAVTEAMILEGKIPDKEGFFAPGNKLY